jgi:hypothetical protein
MVPELYSLCQFLNNKVIQFISLVLKESMNIYIIFSKKNGDHPRFFVLEKDAYIMPGIPPIPPIPPISGIAGAAPAGSGLSEITASVVSSKLAILAAF